jgi:uncharacterized membrane protein
MYLALKLLHILSATVLFGTGLGTAFSMWRANSSADPRVIAVVTRNVALADWLFTTPAAIVQPLTGFALARIAGFSLSSPWLMLTLALYVFVGACWIPVVWLQLRIRDLAREAAATGQPLGPLYHRYFRIWFTLGWPAFLSVIAIFALMVFKPAI